MAQCLTGDNDLMKVQSCQRGGGYPAHLGNGYHGDEQPSHNAEDGRRVNPQLLIYLLPCPPI